MDVLSDLAGLELETMERVCAQGRAQKHAEDTPTDHTADHHFIKAVGHMDQAGPCLDGIDQETGAPHILLAAIRLVFAARCVRAR